MSEEEKKFNLDYQSTEELLRHLYKDVKAIHVKIDNNNTFIHREIDKLDDRIRTLETFKVIIESNKTNNYSWFSLIGWVILAMIGVLETIYKLGIM